MDKQPLWVAKQVHTGNGVGSGGGANGSLSTIEEIFKLNLSDGINP